MFKAPPAVWGPNAIWLPPLRTSTLSMRAIVGKQYAEGAEYGAGAINTPSSIKVTRAERSVPEPRMPMLGRKPNPSSSTKFNPAKACNDCIGLA